MSEKQSDPSAKVPSRTTAQADDLPAGAPDAAAAPAGDRVDIGPISLNVPPEWQFYPLEDRIVGRHTSKIGVLQIKVLPSSAAPAGASHEMFMGVARDMIGYELSRTGANPAKERNGRCIAGGES